MREGIHPELKESVIECVSCGNKIQTRTTKGSFKVEVCNACHPVFTGSGSRLIVDTEGRLERFKRKYGGKKTASS